MFPAFFGSSVQAIARAHNVPTDEMQDLFDEFWVQFAGIKRWQRSTWAEYQRNNYVSTLTGRVRHGPLSWNMAINTPIQNPASDITVDAMVRLANIALEQDKPWLAPVLQIHDDLIGMAPKEHLEEALEVFVREQLAFKAPWVNVPLSVEVEVGQNLFEMESVGKWRSDRV